MIKGTIKFNYDLMFIVFAFIFSSFLIISSIQAFTNMNSKIQLNNTTLTEINPTGKLLRDAIKSIPDFGFINNPDQRRNALLNKIDAIEQMLKVNNTFGAKQKLQNDVKDKIDKWVVDYTPQNPLQLTKGQITDLINEMITRLSKSGHEDIVKLSITGYYIDINIPSESEILFSLTLLFTNVSIILLSFIVVYWKLIKKLNCLQKIFLPTKSKLIISSIVLLVSLFVAYRAPVLTYDIGPFLSILVFPLAFILFIFSQQIKQQIFLFSLLLPISIYVFSCLIVDVYTKVKRK